MLALIPNNNSPAPGPPGAFSLYPLLRFKIRYPIRRPLTADDLLAASKRIVPISVTMEDQINALRTWATNRAIPAAHPLEPQPKPRPTRTTAPDL